MKLTKNSVKIEKYVSVVKQGKKFIKNFEFSLGNIISFAHLYLFVIIVYYFIFLFLGLLFPS